MTIAQDDTAHPSLHDTPAKDSCIEQRLLIKPPNASLQHTSFREVNPAMLQSRTWCCSGPALNSLCHRETGRKAHIASVRSTRGLQSPSMCAVRVRSDLEVFAHVQTTQRSRSECGLSKILRKEEHRSWEGLNNTILLIPRDSPHPESQQLLTNSAKRDLLLGCSRSAHKL
eukprot:4778664-Amphidinium_carterae.3